MEENHRKERTQGEERQGHGFAAMEPEKQRDIARKGGKAAHAQRAAHEFDPDEAREAGRKGGLRVSENREHMAAIGKKGGSRVSQNREHMAAIGKKGGQAVSANREHMAAIGKKGGTARNVKPVGDPEPANENEGSKRSVA